MEEAAGDLRAGIKRGLNTITTAEEAALPGWWTTTLAGRWIEGRRKAVCPSPGPASTPGTEGWF